MRWGLIHDGEEGSSVEGTESDGARVSGRCPVSAERSLSIWVAAVYTSAGRRSRRQICPAGFRQTFEKQGLQGGKVERIRWPVPYGPVRRGSVGPMRVITLRPSAAARCIGPVSFAIMRSACSRTAPSSAREVRPRRSTTPSTPPRGSSGLGSSPPTATTRTRSRRSRSAKSAKDVAGQSLVGHRALGIKTTTGCDPSTGSGEDGNVSGKARSRTYSLNARTTSRYRSTA